MSTSGTLGEAAKGGRNSFKCLRNASLQALVFVREKELGIIQFKLLTTNVLLKMKVHYYTSDVGAHGILRMSYGKYSTTRYETVHRVQSFCRVDTYCRSVWTRTVDSKALNIEYRVFHRFWPRSSSDSEQCRLLDFIHYAPPL